MGKKISIGVSVGVCGLVAGVLYLGNRQNRSTLSSVKSLGEKRLELRARMRKNPSTVLFEKKDWDSIRGKLSESADPKQQLDFLKGLQILVDTKVILQNVEDRGTFFDILVPLFSRKYQNASLGAGIKNFAVRMIVNMDLPLPEKQSSELLSWLDEESSHPWMFKASYQVFANQRVVPVKWVGIIQQKLKSKDPQEFRVALGLVEKMLDFKRQNDTLEELAKRFLKVPQGQDAVTARILFQRGFFKENILKYAFAKKGLQWDEAVLPAYFAIKNRPVKREMLLARLESFQSQKLKERAYQALSQGSVEVGEQ